MLGLPSGVRPDILIAVGHPAATPSPAMKNPPAVVYRDRFGSAWSPPTASSEPRKTVPVRGGTDGPTPFETALYLVASARDCLDEPLIYGPFRMIEGVSRMLEGQASDGFLTEMKAAFSAVLWLSVSTAQAAGGMPRETARSRAASASAGG